MTHFTDTFIPRDILQLNTVAEFKFFMHIPENILFCYVKYYQH